MVQPAAVQTNAGRALIDGDLTIPVKAAGLVVFSHGSALELVSELALKWCTKYVKGAPK